MPAVPSYPSSSTSSVSGIFVVTVFAMWTRIGERASAYGALVAASLVYVAGAYLGLVPHPYLASMAVGLAVYLLAAWPARENSATLR